jgi:hypothetical protein
MPSIQSLFNSVDELRVGALAQAPFCADLGAGKKPTEVYAEATERGFDNLPVRDRDGVIRRMVATSALRDASKWSDVGRRAITLTADTLVARDAPAFSLLDRFAEPGHEILFCLGREGVDGVVTIFDLNAPAAHLLAFGLALIVEAEIAAVLRVELGDDPDEALRRVQKVMPKASGIARWKQARQQGRDLDLASALLFFEKTQLLDRYGGNALAERCGCSKRALMRELDAIRKMRNAVAHYDENYRLANPRWVHNRMRRTLSLARQLAEASADVAAI